ncbi:hypothetical protein AVL57_03895 [Alteromonas stellipolaris]|uniref:Uncharacterized protein n=1 Tax=Alteromonas stellipolaris TaxID=233316 RepID=A0ABM5YGU4_9ALTE|nr:hypothetical protein AVL57_03895 [Alteromonas stellipolaris]
MDSFFAIAVFLFGFVFIAAAILFAYIAYNDRLRGIDWLKPALLISFCLFVAYNTVSSGYCRMIKSGLIG